MNILFIDFECTFQIDEEKRTDPSPYNNKNYLVSVGWALNQEEINYGFFRHNSAPIDPNLFQKLQDAINDADLIVAHNKKFEIQWLRAANFILTSIKYSNGIPTACTQIREYVLAKGLKLGVSLKESCIRNELSLKKSDLIEEFLRKGIGFEEIPWEIVQEYGIADVASLRELYHNQNNRIIDNAHLIPTIELTEEFCQCLLEMEESGIYIDVTELDRLEIEYKTILDRYRKDLQKIVEEVMGATPVNLSSPQQLSELIFSRRVKDKHLWKELFNLGSEIRGSVTKPKHKKRYSKKDFVDIVKNHTEIIYKTTAEHCIECRGKGKIQRIKKNGEIFKNQSICKECKGNGFKLTNLSEIAGLRCTPRSYEDSAVGGFATDKSILSELSQTANGIAHEFLSKISEIGKIENYLVTFIGGIRRKLREIPGTDNKVMILHTQFMQCVTATGRLSSKAPNFQNLPRANNFPLRKVLISRFVDGNLIEADAKQLEFRIAGELSGDRQIFKDTIDGLDVHTATASWTKLSRQDSKPYTFAPVYGATERGKPDHIAAYFIYFRKRYHEHDQWKHNVQDQVLNNIGSYVLPSGREFIFPNTVRYNNGSISNATIMANYPVQAFATADIIPIFNLQVRLLLKEYNAKSILILTVHDSVVIDTHPEEKELVLKILKEAWRITVKEEPIRRWKYEIKIPLEIEIKGGPNWLELKDIH